MLATLLVLPETMTGYPYSDGKLLGLVLIAVCGLREIRWKWTVPHLLIVLQGVLLVASDLLTHPWQDALVVSPERGEGVVYAVCLTLGLLAFASLKDLKVLVPYLHVAAALQGLLVLLHLSGVQPYALLHPTLGRAQEVIGSLGSYAAVAALLALALGVSVLQKAPLPLSVFYAVTLALTTNRSALLIVLPAVLWALWTGRDRVKPLLVVCVLFAAHPVYARLVQGAHGAGHDLQNSHTLTTRLHMWEVLLPHYPQIPHFPYLGGGGDAIRTLTTQVPARDLLSVYLLENNQMALLQDITEVRRLGEDPRSQILAFKVQKADHTEVGMTEMQLDRIHHFFLDKLASGGFFALLCFLVLFVGPLVTPRGRGRTVLLTLGVVMFYQFWFSHLSVEWLLALPALQAWKRKEGQSERETERENHLPGVG